MSLRENGRNPLFSADWHSRPRGAKMPSTMKGQKFKRIAVFLPTWVGDVTMATPALRGLREHFAAAAIVHIGRQLAHDLLTGTNLADEIVVDRSREAPRLGNLGETVRHVCAARCDVGILLPNSFRVALLAKMAGLRRIVGYDRDARGWMLTDRLEPPRHADGGFAPISATDYYIAVVDSLGARCKSRRMELTATPQGMAAADEILARAGVGDSDILVMLNPGANYGPSKMWPAERFAVVADELIRRHGAAVIINASPSERTVARRVAEAMTHEPAVNLADVENNIELLKGLAVRCRVVITNDTGARHVAAALGAAVVTVFGCTDPRWAHIYYPLERMVRVPVDCSPCNKRVCDQPPGPRYHQCMTAVTPDMVIAAAEELLNPAPQGAGV